MLGIEAARGAIISEILNTMGEHGIELDRRHVMLLADLMTYRFFLNLKFNIDEFINFSAEKYLASLAMDWPRWRNQFCFWPPLSAPLTICKYFTKILAIFTFIRYEAAFFGQQDRIVGVSECIIMGTPMFPGTGMFKLLQRQKQAKDEKMAQTAMVWFYKIQIILCELKF